MGRRRKERPAAPKKVDSAPKYVYNRENRRIGALRPIPRGDCVLIVRIWKYPQKQGDIDMKFEFKGITAEELCFKLNRIKLNPEDKLDIKPQFSRQVRKVNGNEKLNFVALSVKVESTEAEPKPFNINVTLVGVFEVTDALSDADTRKFVVEATKSMYPYLRSAVTNLTANAYIAPLNLPVISGPIFPEDRDTYAFSVGADNLN